MAKNKTQQLAFDFFEDVQVEKIVSPNIKPIIKSGDASAFDLIMWSMHEFGDTILGYSFIKNGLLRFDDDGEEIEIRFYIGKYHNPDERENLDRRFYSEVADKMLSKEIKTFEDFKQFKKNYYG